MDAQPQIVEGYHNQVRLDVVPAVPESNGVLVDIGGGTGATAAYMKAHGRAGRAGVVDLVHNDGGPEVDFRHLGDIEDREFIAEVAATDGPFDTILCLDILEHLRDPWALVAQLHRSLKPGGVIVASIPNVRHYRVSGGLLFGNKWNLADAGILDRTHLRFFVRDTAIALMTHSGLVLEDLAPTLKSPKARAFSKLTFGRLDSLVNVQFVIRVRRPLDDQAR